MADGSRHSIFQVLESTYGTTPANPALELVRNTGTTLGLSRDSFMSEELRADRQINDFRLGTNSNEGEINIELSYESFEKAIEAVLMTNDGFASGTVGEIRAGTTRRSFSVFRNFSDIDDFPWHSFAGVEYNTLSLTIPASGVITGSLGAIAQVFNTLATLPGTPTFPTESSTSVMDSFSGAVRLGGTSSGVVTEMSISIDNGLTARNVVGSRNIIRPSIGRSNVSGSIQVYFEDSTLLNNFRDEDLSSLEFTLSDVAGNAYVFTLPRLKFSSGKPDVSDMGPIMLAMSFQAYLDPVEGTNIIINKVDA